MTEPEVNLDNVFGPMRPEAEEEALLLKGYDSPDPEVLMFIKGLDIDSKAAFLEFHNYHAEDVIVHITGLLDGYHFRDPERAYAETYGVVEDELSKARTYLTILHDNPKVPMLVVAEPIAGADSSEIAPEPVWIFGPSKGLMQGMIFSWRRAMDNYERALQDPEFADQNLPLWAQAYLDDEKAEPQSSL